MGLRISRPETRVNTGLAGSFSEDARFTRAAGQVVLRVFGRGGCASDGDASPRRGAPIRSGYFGNSPECLLWRDGGGWMVFRTASILGCKLRGGLFTIADVDDEAPFCLICFALQKGQLFVQSLGSPLKPCSIRLQALFITLNVLTPVFTTSLNG